MACPMTAQELQPNVQDVEQLKMFPCLDDNTITWLEIYRRGSRPTSLKSRTLSAPRRPDGVVEAPQAQPTTLVVCCIQFKFSFGSAIKCSSRASVHHPSLTLWRPPSWSTWGLFGGRRDACIQLSWLTYCTPVWCADGHTCAGVRATSPLPLPALLLSFVNRHTCTYKLTHTCAKPHWYRHILIHVTTCLDINFYLPFTVQYVVAMTIFHLRQANLIKYTSDQKFISWCASTVEHYFTFWALNGH